MDWIQKKNLHWRSVFFTLWFLTVHAKWQAISCSFHVGIHPQTVSNNKLFFLKCYCLAFCQSNKKSNQHIFQMFLKNFREKCIYLKIILDCRFYGYYTTGVLSTHASKSSVVDYVILCHKLWMLFTVFNSRKILKENDIFVSVEINI